jgi:hypothetical protein
VANLTGAALLVVSMAISIGAGRVVLSAIISSFRR